MSLMSHLPHRVFEGHRCNFQLVLVASLREKSKTKESLNSLLIYTIMKRLHNWKVSRNSKKLAEDVLHHSKMSSYVT